MILIVPKSIPTLLSEAVRKVQGSVLGDKEGTVLVLLLEHTLNTSGANIGRTTSGGYL